MKSNIENKKILNEELIDELSDYYFSHITGTKLLNFNKAIIRAFTETNNKIPIIKSIIDIPLAKELIKKTRKRKLDEIDDVKQIGLLKIGNLFYILDIQYYAGYRFTPRSLACFDKRKNLLFKTGSLEDIYYRLLFKLEDSKFSNDLKKIKTKPLDSYFTNNLANQKQKKKSIEIYKIKNIYYSIHQRSYFYDKPINIPYDSRWYVKEYDTNKIIIGNATTLNDAKKQLMDFLIKRGRA